MFSVFFASLFCAFITNAVFACTSNQIDVAGDGTNCQRSKFELTTTNLSAGDSFKFSMSAMGTFYVDCGDGGTLSGTHASGKTISKNTNFSVTYTCEWASAGAHTIRFGGIATEYAVVALDITSDKSAIAFDNLVNGNAAKIASISGSFVELFPQIGTSASQIPQFINTFKNATNLTTIPSTLFKGYTGGEHADFMFYGTFTGCTGLTSMPEWLFSTITTPADSMFSQTFEGCTNMSGYIPPSTFIGLVAAGHPSATTLWYDTFEDTNLVATCPSGVPQYVTGYEGNRNNTTWNGAISCGCAPGAHLENGACVCDTFTVTTTNLSANYEMSFLMSAAGIFAVDWGDGSAIETIYRVGNTDSAQTYSHTYTMPGSYTIGFCGTTPTAYRIPDSKDKPDIEDTTISFNTASNSKVASIGGSLGALFPTLNNGASDTDFPRFYKTFQSCTSLTSIPSGLFTGVTGAANAMFRETFDRCSGITTIPSNLFSGVSGGAKNMFRSVFYSCTSLTAIPENLFSGVTVAAENEFKYSFHDDKAMSGYIPPSTFSGLIAAGSPTATNMWQNTFTENTLATSCNSFTGMTQFITGYETKWNNKVSCQPATCPAGKMLIGGACDDPVFTVTTTSDTTSLVFSLAASGTFYVDCGDGGALTGSGVNSTQIIRSGTGSSLYTCTWESAGAHTVRFGGAASAYGTDSSISFWRSSNGTQANIASVSGSLSSVFPQHATGNGEAPVFMNTFKECTNLTAIPATLFDGITGGNQNMFSSTFEGCTNLAAIPSGLFGDLETGAQNMFANTFKGCTSLTTIPSNMFGDISNGEASLFYGTFKNCTGITSIPSDLFSNITSAANSIFSETFNGCTNLSGYIPSTTFAGLIANNSPTATDMWLSTFNNTNVATSCAPYTDMRQYITNYETAWNGKVSCELSPNRCTGATYYDVNDVNADANGCVTCPSGYTYNTTNYKDSVEQCEIHCAHGTYVATAGGACVAVDNGYFAAESTIAYGETGNQQVLQTCTGATYRNANNQCVACPNGYNYNTDSGKTSINQCQIHCNAGHYLARAGDSSCSEVGDGYYAAAETLNYGSVSNHTRCPNPEETTGTMTAESVAECSLLCTGATYFDSSTDRCVACPSGYTAHTLSGKTSVSQCQIACAAGTYLAAAGDTSCINVGYGYWAASSTVNYGSTSARTACSSGAITNSDHAGSVSECLAVCTGATYRNSNNQCVACPSGYVDNLDDGKTSINQCQHRCNAGTYMTKYTPVEYLQGDGVGTFIDTNYSITSNNVTIKLVVGTRGTTTGDVGNFFGNIYELGGISSNYKGNVFGLWMRHTGNNGAKATSANMTFFEGIKYTIDYTVTSNGTANGTISVNGGNPGNKQVANSRFNAAGNKFKLFTNGGAYIDENDEVNVSRWGDKLFNGKIYSLKLWDGGNTDADLKLDLVPVRRDDGVLGFYNRVNSEFYPNVGTGNFTSATCSVDIDDASDVCDAIATCSPVGYGYYANENYTNYGSDGVRNQCPNGGGTIVNNQPINNATSIYNCEGVDPCTGANYPDYLTGVCTPCPSGYDADTTNNKESINQCKIHCNAGYYVREEYDSSCTATDNGYYIAANDVKYGDISDPSMCTNAPGHATYSGNATTNSCPWLCDATYYAVDGACVDAGVGYYSADGENGRHECTNITPTNSSYSGSASSDNCPWACDTNYSESNGECILTGTCIGATYADSGVCTPCPTGYDANTVSGKTSASECQLVCPAGTYMATANGVTCTDAGAGFWAPGGVVSYGSTSARTACASGLTTVGYGHGADELADCGRKLHVGNYIIYAKTSKPTTPAINIQPENDSVYYVGVSGTDHTLTTVHVTQGNTQYTAFDDSILYGERDFETNARITQ